MATAYADYLKPDVSGLWAHSHNEDSDLMKKYVVEKRTPSGWLAVASFHDEDTAHYKVCDIFEEVRVMDQFNKVVVLHLPKA